MHSSPLILLGRGGSGTRLLSQIFHDSGVFLGNELNVSYDSMEWVRPIYSGLTHKLDLGGSPQELTLPDFAAQLRQTAAQIHQAAEREIDLWGWKLPETMMIVPEVLAAFPKAKIIQIVRHPITSSLRRTHKTSRQKDSIGGPVLNAARAQIAIPAQHQLDEDTLNNALSWQYQVQAVTEFCRANLPAARYLELRYEDLFDTWPQTRTRLCHFTGIAPDALICPDLEPGRRRSFALPDPRIKDVWEITKTLAALHGYALASDGTPLTQPQP